MVEAAVAVRPVTAPGAVKRVVADAVAPAEVWASLAFATTVKV